MAGYYDYVLGLIPAALIGVTAVLNLAGLPLTAALPGGAVVAGTVMVHAMFVRNPVTADRGGAECSRDGRVGGSIDRAVERSRTGRSSAGGSD